MNRLVHLSVWLSEQTVNLTINYLFIFIRYNAFNLTLNLTVNLTVKLTVNMTPNMLYVNRLVMSI